MSVPGQRTCRPTRETPMWSGPRRSPEPRSPAHPGLDDLCQGVGLRAGHEGVHDHCVTNDIDTLATALHVRADDLLKQYPDLAPWRPKIGLQPRLTDAELVTLAVRQALLGLHLRGRWIRHARAHPSRRRRRTECRWRSSCRCTTSKAISHAPCNGCRDTSSSDSRSGPLSRSPTTAAPTAPGRSPGRSPHTCPMSGWPDRTARPGACARASVEQRGRGPRLHGRRPVHRPQRPAPACRAATVRATRPARSSPAAARC